MLKQTPLNSLHRAMGARMVDFGGWDMPVNYGSQIEEHHQVRRDAGMFDVCHMLVVDVTGTGIREFLRYLLANNADKLKEPGKALYSCMLNPTGGVIDDLIVYFMREDWFRIVVNAGTAEKDVAWMEQQRAAHAPQLTIKPRRDLAMIAVQGPNAREKTWQAIAGSRAATESLKPFQAAEFAQYFIGRTGYTGEDGFEIMLPVAEAGSLWQTLHDCGVGPIGLGARDTLRLEAGMNLYGQDMGEDVNPLEAGLAWTIDLVSPRDFIGKQALLAKPPTMHMLGLVLLDKGVLRGHQKVITPLGEGEITSGSFSPTLNLSIAFARMPLAVAVGDTVQVEIRDKRLNAKVVKPPFARNGKSLITI
ncbi:glycine cleavage system aminomethyltransferase GcvT [Sulfuricella sp.]|uniref:glycine cleavage system aminomethyltransferase GcvT n=1 Tax=Sulfuricella sp. TaxID=2099377 RepID=UPI002C6E0EA9|nr:glycine cleavage system aminomethyltransferase GcvT [Sulfuricella sp.]HUX62778.1 glycine cleavage system aminomethyltransferase GcvT [Sulfuricella sp.]